MESDERIKELEEELRKLKKENHELKKKYIDEEVKLDDSSDFYSAHFLAVAIIICVTLSYVSHGLENIVTACIMFLFAEMVFIIVPPVNKAIFTGRSRGMKIFLAIVIFGLLLGVLPYFRVSIYMFVMGISDSLYSLV